MSSRRPWGMVGWVTAGYAGLSVLMTWPMARHPSLPYAAIQGDFGLWLWDLWWMKKAVVDLRTSPYFTSHLFYPTGTSLVFHNLSPSNGVLGIPLQLLGADVITTYNLLYLSSFVIGGAGMFLLARELTGNAFASFFAGTVYAFSPSHTLPYAVMNLWANHWLPLGLLYGVRLLRGGHPLDGIGLAILLALASLTDWHQPVLLCLALLALALSFLGQRNTRSVQPGVLRRVSGSILAYGLLISPLAYIVLREFIGGDVHLQTRSWFTAFEIFGWRRHLGGIVSYGVLLGWIPLAVMIYGVSRGLDPWARRFAVLLVMFFVLSLGERLRIPGAEGVALPLPFLLWRKLPLLGVIRGSIYFWTMVEVCFAVLVAHGAHELWHRVQEWRPRTFPGARPVFGMSLVLLTLLEFLQAPLAPADRSVHPVYDMIRRETDRRAILDAPIGYTNYTTGTSTFHSGRSMYLQTMHGHPLVGGYTQFDGAKRLAFLDQNSILQLFVDRREAPAIEEQGDAGARLRAFLVDHGISWMILHKAIREQACDPPRTPGWTIEKFVNAVAPAVANAELRALWAPERYCGNWEAERLRKTEALVRRTLGPPLWDDDMLVAYRVP